jgi:hypothetical protein
MFYRDYLLFSNGGFFVPLVLACMWDTWWYAVVLAVSMGLSFVYHVSEEKRFERTDLVCALLLMAANAVLLLRGGLTPVGYTGAAVVVAVLALVVYARQRANYGLRHGMYHVLSALVCIFCLLVFHY